MQIVVNVGVNVKRWTLINVGLAIAELLVLNVFCQFYARPNWSDFVLGILSPNFTQTAGSQKLHLVIFRKYIIGNIF